MSLVKSQHKFLSLKINGGDYPVEEIFSVTLPDMNDPAWGIQYIDGSMILATGSVTLEYKRI